MLMVFRYNGCMGIRDIVKKFIPKNLLKSVTYVGHLAEALIATIVYGFPARKMKFVGVTGTNGKTSTTIMIAAILRKAGYSVGMSTTAVINDGKTEYENNLDGGLTNATPFTIQRLLKTMRRNGVEWVAMEAGSQGLYQHRLFGLKFAGAAITNLTNDHLDYHGNMDSYAAAKAKLFRQAKGGVLVTNADDEWADYFAKQGQGTRVNYGKKATDFRLISVQSDQKSSLVNFEYKGQKEQLKLKVQGVFNAYNALAAAAICSGLGVDLRTILSALENLEKIPGRMETVDCGQDFRVIVDYAHTPDAVQNILTTARNITKGRLICVSGAAGDRAVSRRAPVGKIASQLCDIFVVTDDEPHTEDPTKIRSQIMSGVIKSKDTAQVYEVADRTDAMKKAVSMAQKDDTIVIAGMGHQKYRSGPNGHEDWDDIAVVTAVIGGKTSELSTNWRKVMHDSFPNEY